VTFKLPKGTKYTVTETTNSEYTTSVRLTVGTATSTNGATISATLSADHKVAYTNNKNVAPPTGVDHSGYAAYALVALAALMGTVFAIEGRRKKRDR
ncbi:MAG: hypothetical protein IJ072_07050, partial [Oscillospiraceae bacterium]|nr:hypothetical protein [Oscillospiraceae bacterium]